MNPTGHSARTRAMDEFNGCSYKPLHVVIQGKEFDDVRGKSKEQVMSELRERAKTIAFGNPESRTLFEKAKKMWVHEELEKLRCKKQGRPLRRRQESPPTPNQESQRVCEEALDSTGRNTRARVMKTYGGYHDKPLHVVVQGEEFDDVRGKSKEQVMSELRESAKTIAFGNPESRAMFERAKQIWARQEFERMRRKKRKQWTAKKGKTQAIKARNP